MNEKKIGEVFEFEGVKLICSLGEVCTNCYFNSMSACTSIAGNCGPKSRDDGKSVVFIKVNDMRTKDFDLNEAKKGAEIVTVSGQNVRLICFDRRNDNGYNIVGLIEDVRTKDEFICYFNDKGEPYDCAFECCELKIKTKIVEKWCNVYRDSYDSFYTSKMFDNKQDAINFVSDDNYVDTVKISFEI